MSHTIELRKVSKYYSDEDSVSMGFSRVDLDLDIGEFVIITGESGSGKSTLLNVISGLDTYEEGEMFVCGEDTALYGTEDYERYRKIYIGNIFQDFNLINSYTVFQNIELVMLISGCKKSECKKRVDELIELVGLIEFRNTKAAKLSGGQKQRVAIARALAKNAPIIVADEPTGNLDSISAESVMETLAKVSKDKLVVIVTHNYEQAEPYATRKLTMHDGRIIEDIAIDQAKEYDDINTATADIGAINQKSMRKASELRLGMRNTFNLPIKFILLFIVYFFVSTAVLSQYASTKNSMHEVDILGINPFFPNTSSERLVVKKADESNFTEKDFATIESTPNVKSIIKNDIAIDSGVSFSLGDFVVEGPVVPAEQINADMITFGHMPQDDYEIVIMVDNSSEYFLHLAGNGNEYIGRSIELMDMSRKQMYSFSKDITIAGIILDNDGEQSSDYAMHGYSTIFAREAVTNDILISLMASASKTELNFGGIRVNNDYGRAVYSSSNVPDRMVYIFEDQLYYYNDEEAVGKDFSLKVKNRFFESEGKYTVKEIITSSNCEKLMGIPKEDYDAYINCVFISNNDFRELFDKGYYQISVYMINEQESDSTQLSLREKGFTTMAIKDSLPDTTGGLGSMLNLMTYGRLALEFVILFLIAYVVIRLIMKSRNPYYSTLRILGASKSNTSNILKTELILMMIIAYGVIVLFVLLVNKGILQEMTNYRFKEIEKLLYYLTNADYCILGVLLLLVSLLIANTYSRHIFSKSAMKTFREEV